MGGLDGERADKAHRAQLQSRRILVPIARVSLFCDWFRLWGVSMRKNVEKLATDERGFAQMAGVLPVFDPG